MRAPPLTVPGWANLVVASAVLVTAAGCTKPIKLVPAGGSVEIGGAPAAGIVVQFLPQANDGENRPSSFATTGPDGRFDLMTHGGKPGAVEGLHSVLLVDTLEERPAQGSRATKPPRLDSRYATVSGGLTATVTEGGAPITLQVPAAVASP
jgi:hypothetical protein